MWPSRVVGSRSKRLPRHSLAKANELRTALLAAVSHDLRTPLASIKTAATSLLSDDVAFDLAATRELLQTIDQEAERLNKLVGNLLDMSRDPAGAVAVQARPVASTKWVALALASLPASGRVERGGGGEPAEGLRGCRPSRAGGRQSDR